MTKQATSRTLGVSERKRLTEIHEQLRWILDGSDGRSPSRRLCTRCGLRDRALTLQGDAAHNSLCSECYTVYELTT